MNSTGVAAGFFAGQLDEARIWSTARSGAQIASSMNTEIPDSHRGPTGTVGPERGNGYQRRQHERLLAPAGTLTNGPTWVAGATALNPAAPGANAALIFNGSNQYAGFGNTSALGAAQFTLETWFKRTSAGVGTLDRRHGAAELDPARGQGPFRTGHAREPRT